MVVTIPRSWMWTWDLAMRVALAVAVVLVHAQYIWVAIGQGYDLGVVHGHVSGWVRPVKQCHVPLK